ncbi:MAG TPA: Hsp33 family molecular chaperone HslO, partial [Longimicrobium sp.]|nr:Hsp33 family molecular chaperone HslO [Longimicrobium sp.]
MNGDYLVRATALDGRVRAFALTATHAVSELQRRHDTFPAVTAALGRTALGALLLGAASLKEEHHSLSIEVKGGGPVGRILATVNGLGEVRGLVSHPHAHVDSRDGKLNVAGVVGTEGYLSVTRSLGMRETYQGMVELISGEIGMDLAYYLGKSEQTNSGVAVGVFIRPDHTVEAAGGYLVQLLPGLDDTEVGEIERALASLPHPTDLIRHGVTPEQVLERVFPGGFELLDRYPVGFRCQCSREKVESMIISLGPDEIRRIIDEEKEPY